MLNKPQNQHRYRRGDPSPVGDGLVFSCYMHSKEVWVTPDELTSRREIQKQRMKAERAKAANTPRPSKAYRVGDSHPSGNGKVFRGYHAGWKEWWTTPEKLELAREIARGHSQRINTKPDRKKWRKQWAKNPETIARIEAKKLDPEWLRQKRAKNNADQKRRRAENPSFRVAHNLRVRINSAMIRCGGKKAATTEALIGCSMDAFRLHIESQFKPGMTWGDRSAWHIDHILPLSLFDLTKPEQQKIAFNYKNCRPEWKTENLQKCDSVDGELFLGRHYHKPSKIVPFKAA